MGGVEILAWSLASGSSAGRHMVSPARQVVAEGTCGPSNSPGNHNFRTLPSLQPLFLAYGRLPELSGSRKESVPTRLA